MRVPFHGGPLGVGRDFVTDFARLTDGRLTFRGPLAQKLYRDHLARFGARELGEVPVPLVSTFGCALTSLAGVELWRVHRVGDGFPEGFPDGFLESPFFRTLARALTRHALEFYRHAVEVSPRVVAVLPPQRVPEGADPAVFAALQETVREAVEECGAEIVDPRPKATDEHGRQRPEFSDPDSPLHGNVAFGRLIVADLLDRGL
ncbi:hypothetical protein [Streptomyces sedi]|nr:hypothetical protein [Streptomyces sedi]